MQKNTAIMELDQVVEIVYTNYRGETSRRLIIPRSIWFGKTNWHPEPQWLLDALDLEKNAERSFALQDISQWSTNAYSKMDASK